MFEANTYWTCNVERHMFHKPYKDEFPNTPYAQLRPEPVATDTVYADTPDTDDDSTCTQIIATTESLVTDVYGMNLVSEFVRTMQDNIQERGVMDKLINDSAKTKISVEI